MLDQVLQGPFMISTMFVWTGLLQGERLAQTLGTVRARIWDTWVKSVYATRGAGPFLDGRRGPQLSPDAERPTHVHAQHTHNTTQVWSPVQAVQQLVVPLEYRVAVANGVSYFWDTYLAHEMAPGHHDSQEEEPSL